MQRPARPSFWWIATDQCNEISFFTSVEFVLVDVVGLTASNRREAVLGVALPNASNCSEMTADGFTDLLVRQAINKKTMRV